MVDPTRCTQCSHPLEDGQNFCVSCGTAVVHDPRVALDPLIGRLLCGKYRVKGILGAGSMGIVYKACHETLGKDVAIKVLRRRLVSDRNVVRRFKQEARAASRLNHPNTIQVLDFGELDGGELFMAMEFVDGRDLAMVIQQDGPLPPARLAHIITQVCSALYEAHDNGIVHRDLKPANVLVADLRSQKDHVKVLDFGIAKMLDPDPSQSIPMTREGFVCGTPAFMSPEQVQGFELDGRSDLFALGVCLYQGLTGKLPFTAPTPLELATALVTEDPVPPSEARPDWAPDPVLEAICLKALQKKPDDRYGSALEMIDDLAEIRTETARPNAASPRKSDPATTAPLEDDDEQATQVSAPALTPAGSPNKAHLDLPPAQKRESSAAQLLTVEMAQIPITRGRARLRTIVVLAAASIAGFVLVTLALDRFMPAEQAPTVTPPTPSKSVSPPPAPTPEATVPQLAPEGSASTLEPTAKTPGRKRKRKSKRREAPPQAAPPAKAATVEAPKASVAPAAVDKRQRARELHAEASAALRSGDQKKALKRLQAAVALDPLYAPLHRDLGKLYIRRRRPKKGVAHYKRYLALSPNASDASTYRAIIRRLQ